MAERTPPSDHGGAPDNRDPIDVAEQWVEVALQGRPWEVRDNYPYTDGYKAWVERGTVRDGDNERLICRGRRDQGTTGSRMSETFRQPWRFIIPRWFKCWRKTRHAQRTFVAPSQGQWTECYCGLRCYGSRPPAIKARQEAE